MANDLGPRKVDNEFKNYVGKYVTIEVLPQGQTYYGYLKSFEKRVAVLNPYRGDTLKEGRLENCLLSKDKTIELKGLNVAIEDISNEVIEEYCKHTNANNFLRIRETYDKIQLIKEKDNPPLQN
jgi:hypothetical protein